MRIGGIYGFVIGLWTLLFVFAGSTFAQKGGEAASAFAEEFQRPVKHYRSEPAQVATHENGLHQPVSFASSSAVRPQKTLQDRFWEHMLLIFGGIFVVWLAILIIAVAITSSTATGILLGIAAATAYIGIGALLIALFAFTMIRTREQRRARRRQFWRSF